MLDANTRAAASSGTTVFGARLKALNMRGVDKVAITVGEAAFRRFRIDKLGDYASEKIIQHIFSVRAFVNPADSANLILAQATQEGALRQQTLKRLRTARAFMAAGTPEIKTAQAQSLRAAWANFKADDPRAVGAVRDARLAVVVGKVLQTLGFPDPGNVDLVKSSKAQRRHNDPGKYGTFYFRY